MAEHDPDELIRVMQHDLRTPRDYEEIAGLLSSCGRTGEAIDWAQRGLAAFADRHWQTPPLRELLGAMLRGRGEDATALWWDAFERAPSVESYRRLLAEVAKPERAALGMRAVEVLRHRVAEGEPQSGNPLLTATPVGALVDILLYEGDIDGAWSVADGRDLDERRLLKLAVAREKSHPLDVVPIYVAAASSEINRTDNKGYRKGVVHLDRVRTIVVEAGRPELFDQVLADVRMTHKAKRNLMAMLDKKGW